MRVAHRLATLIAVLSAVLVRSVGAHSNSSLSSRAGTSTSHHHRPWLTAREMQNLVRREAEESDTGAVDCCPTVLEMVEPLGGMNQQGMLVELYMGGPHKQRFYEVSCRKDVENKPCRFVQKNLYNQSKCVQKYSYTYALAKDPNWVGDHPVNHRHHRDKHTIPQLPAGGWMLDYIRVRSGCACELRPKRKQHSSSNRHERRKHETDISAYESPPDT